MLPEVKNWTRQTINASFLKTRLFLWAVVVRVWQAVRLVPNKHNHLVLKTASLLFSRCGTQSSLYNRNKQHILHGWGTLVWEPPQCCACFYLNLFLLFLLWSQYAMKTFPLLFPSASLPSFLCDWRLRHNLPLLPESQPTPCWGWGSACLRSRIEK